MPTISSTIDAQLDSVRQLCRRHHVARLELFGSAATGTFDASRSDLDFLVEFLPLLPRLRADAYFGLLADLQDLFQRGIDLVEAEAVTNPFFKRRLDLDRTVLYAA